MKGFFRAIFLLPIFLLAREEFLSLGELGSVRYEFENNKLLKVVRLSPEDDELYSHNYCYGEDGKLIAERLIGGVGEIIHHGDGSVSTPFERQQMILSKKFDQEDCEYDERGCLIRNGTTFYEYDDKLQLVKVTTEQSEVIYLYNDQGKRVSREEDGKSVYFGYLGINDLVISSDQGVEQLRIPGVSFHPQMVRAIAIETKDAVYAPIHNYTGNIVQLINIHSKELINLGNDDAYGRKIPKDLPVSWIFSGKHYDQSTDLVYFGARYYCPSLKQWLTPDPMNQVDGEPYQYCFNDPNHYFDPDGNWVFVIPLALEAGPWLYAGGAAIAGYLLAEGANYANQEIQRAQFEKERQRLAWELEGLPPHGIGIHGEIDRIAYEQWAKNRCMQKQKESEPPYTWDDLGDDPSKCPGEGFEWRGDSKPKDGLGNWIRGDKKIEKN